MNNAAQKTPISLLQELCATHNLTPDYKLISVEGAVHAPTFMYQVQVNEVVTTASGQSKKKAKHAAAKAALEALLSKDGQYKDGFVSDGVKVNMDSLEGIINEATTTTTTTTSTTSSTPATEPTAADDAAYGNPIGALQEFCMRHRWQPPYYETERATGLPHEKVFSIICVVDRYQTSGEGKSKRLAKRQAAYNMYVRLKDLKILDETEEAAIKQFEDLKIYDKEDPENYQSNLSRTYSKNVLKFLKDLKTSNSSYMQVLQDVDLLEPRLDCVTLLKNVATEQNFDVIYIPIEQRGKTGDYHCLVQITSLPVAVCFGSGASREDSQVAAARNALYFIQLMCRK